jgi:hypothetical protein
MIIKRRKTFMPDIKERGIEKKEEHSDSAGYCPYTPDRRCKTGKEGGWSKCEECDTCGWRAW